MGAELQPLPEPVAKLMAPGDLGKALIARLREEVARVRQERGEVVTAADTFELMRSLAAAQDKFTDYGRAFTSAAKVVKQEVEEELKFAVGEQDDTPLGSLSVPDTDGTTIKVGVQNENEHTIDRDQLFSAIAAKVLLETGAVDGALALGVEFLAMQTIGLESEVAGKMETFLAGVIVEAMESAVAVGTYAPQVSKVRALATYLAGKGADGLAGIVTSAVRTKKIYKGITVKREQAK